MSETAKNCPHCGFVKPVSGGVKVMIVIALIVFGYAIASLIL